MTNAQKAQRLERQAVWKERIAHTAAQDDGNGKERSAELLIDAALLREAAAMMRERGESGWTAQFEREYKGKTLAVVEAGPVGWYWYVDGSADYEAEIALTLEAAQAAAVAWVDEQEGRDV
jgi:hypothetical protein